MRMKLMKILGAAIMAGLLLALPAAGCSKNATTTGSESDIPKSDVERVELLSFHRANR